MYDVGAGAVIKSESSHGLSEGSDKIRVITRPGDTIAGKSGESGVYMVYTRYMTTCWHMPSIYLVYAMSMTMLAISRGYAI
jgi:hypothetical protein